MYSIWYVWSKVILALRCLLWPAWLEAKCHTRAGYNGGQDACEYFDLWIFAVYPLRGWPLEEKEETWEHQKSLDRRKKVTDIAVCAADMLSLPMPTMSSIFRTDQQVQWNQMIWDPCCIIRSNLLTSSVKVEFSRHLIHIVQRSLKYWHSF